MKKFKTKILEILKQQEDMTFLDIVKSLNTNYASTRTAIVEMTYSGEVEPIGTDSYKAVCNGK